MDPHVPPDAPNQDTLLRFLLARNGVRGVLVSLDEVWQEIRARGSYPESLAGLLGEATSAAALFTGHIKVEGRLSVQFKGRGALRTLFAECTHEGRLRGIALWQPPLPEPLDLAHLGEDAVLAITIEGAARQGREGLRQQGLVAVGQATLARAFEDYFLQSEQLPTRLLLAADARRARGLMLQVLPDSLRDEDAWPRTQALFDTLGRTELLETEPELLLHRLFHEEAPELLSRRALAFGCSCSRERVAGMLLALGHEEARSALEPATGVLDVRCEFCGQRYLFDAVDLEQLFAGGGIDPATPTTH
ncbi:MAG: 33 kDa chaperonin [Lysobacteraceae bacterium]|nr:MAG: 33 kDa chaperonin [Xanthomonadaceae bacterium]